MATPIPDNRARFSLAKLVAATGGTAIDLDSDAQIIGIATDSRTIAAGALFVALRGASHDGHLFVDAARARGALALVARDAAISGPCLEVDDTLVALGRIARAFVARSFAADGARPVLAVGGAAGKTTTKALAAAAAEALFGATLVTAGNLNNRIGVPMTLLTLEPRHRALVLECGTSERGEIAALGEIARPDVALVTNVGIEHSAGLGTLDEIADEEAALFAAARRVAVTSSAEPLLLDRLARSAVPARLVFGGAESADFRLIGRSPGDDGSTELRFEVGSRLSGRRDVTTELGVSTPLVGPAAAENVAAALCGALALLDRPATDEELVRAAEAIGAVAAVPGRLSPRKIGEILVLDDSYNSNPKSVPAALAAARELAERRQARLVVALGDMLELGALAAAQHEEMVAQASNCGAALLVLVGEECGRARSRLSFATPFKWYPDSTLAARSLPALARPGDVVLVKGSRGVRMERLVEALESSSPRA
jgi:UDP-N-acetylmuramoyl-tripeptide--D-alanyl-D-alanine ligase